MKRIIALLLVTSIIGTGAVFAEVENDRNVVYKLEELGSFMKNGVKMLPVREISEDLGFVVRWNGDIKKVEITKGAINTSLRVGENSYVFAKMSPIALSNAPEIRDGKTYVPIEFFQRILKLNVLLDGELVEIGEDPAVDFIELEGYIKNIVVKDSKARILVGIEKSEGVKGEIYLLTDDSTKLLDEKHNLISEEKLNVGDRINAKVSRVMASSMPPQAAVYEIQVEGYMTFEDAKRGGIVYPVVTIDSSAEKTKQVNKLIEDKVKELEGTEIYKGLESSYIVKSMNDDILSIVFVGNYDFLGNEKSLFTDLNIDLESGSLIDFENYFKTDEKSQEKLDEVLRQRVEKDLGKTFEAEGKSLFFTENNIAVYYYEMDDSVTEPTIVYLTRDMVKDLIQK